MALSSTIGIGIIGAGSIARAHVRAYQAWPDDCRVVATADIVPEKARDMAVAAGAEAWYADYGDLLRRPDVDLVSICTPPFVHAPATIAALRAGKHVLCEKPMAASPHECDEMIAAAQECGKILSVVFQNRFRPDIWRAKQIVDSGLLGRLLVGKCETLW